jgi:hypothetical protein
MKTFKAVLLQKNLDGKVACLLSFEVHLKPFIMFVLVLLDILLFSRKENLFI